MGLHLHRGNGRNILVRQQDYSLFELITRDHAKSYRQHYLKTQILGLSGNSLSPDNLLSRFMVLKRKLSLQGVDVHYEIHNGENILITQIEFKARKTGTEAAGLRRIQFSSGQWEADPTTKLRKIEAGQPVHVAINGLAGSVKDARFHQPRLPQAGPG